jgi:hypothetical protein
MNNWDLKYLHLGVENQNPQERELKTNRETKMKLKISSFFISQYFLHIYCSFLLHFQENSNKKFQETHISYKELSWNERFLILQQERNEREKKVRKWSLNARFSSGNWKEPNKYDYEEKRENLKTWIEREFSLVNKQVSRIDFD